jgi:hypothetical protein
MSEWIDMQEGCNNCGKPLEARPSTIRGSFVIQGYEPMEWRHTDGTVQCVILRSPKPYTEANQYKEYCSLRDAQQHGACDGN